MVFFTPSTHYSCNSPELRNKEMCRDVQRDPYGHLMSNWEKQTAKMLPLRMFVNFVAASSFALYYMSRTNEINRVRRLKFSIDMVVNVTARAALAGIVSDVCTRKLFVNYNRITEHKVAKNEVSKIMRQMPNARPYLAPHEKPNSYYFAM